MSRSSVPLDAGGGAVAARAVVAARRRRDPVPAPVTEQASLRGMAARRRWLHWSQETAAHSLGVDVTTYRRWERGRCVPRPWAQQRLAKAFRVPLATVGRWTAARESAPPPTAEVGVRPDHEATTAAPQPSADGESACPLCGTAVNPGQAVDRATANRSTPLRQRRKAMALTQRDLAARIGVSECTYGRWERGQAVPFAEHQQGLADALAVPLPLVKLWTIVGSLHQTTGTSQ